MNWLERQLDKIPAWVWIWLSILWLAGYSYILGHDMQEYGIRCNPLSFFVRVMTGQL